MERPEFESSLLEASEVRTRPGHHPSQIVLREVKPGTYATHLKIVPPEQECSFILGRYFFSLAEATKDYQQRVRELEESSLRQRD
ncbi:MAG: hypothetical protein AB1898_29210 [Acidobacteriota bacterium]